MYCLLITCLTLLIKIVPLSGPCLLHWATMFLLWDTNSHKLLILWFVFELGFFDYTCFWNSWNFMLSVVPSFLFLYFRVWMYHNLLIRLSIESHLGCFWFGTFVNKVIVNICGQVFWCTCFYFSWGNVIVLKSGWTIFHSYHQCMRVSVIPHSCQHLVLSIFVLWAILLWVVIFNVMLSCRPVLQSTILCLSWPFCFLLWSPVYQLFFHDFS